MNSPQADRQLATLRMYEDVVPKLARTLLGLINIRDGILARTGVSYAAWTEMTYADREALIRRDRKARKVEP